MSNLENTILLLKHMKWADAEIWKKILTLSSAEPDNRIKKLLYHVHQVQYAFYFLWINKSLEIPKPEDFTNYQEIIRWGSNYQKLLNDFINSQEISNPDRIIEIPWSKFLERKTRIKTAPTTFLETVMQVTTHSVYHRAQINTRFRELGIEPTSIDFIFWIWLGKPAADIPLT
jgi:uncharacterized damage-inducible protein DinB